MSQGEAGTQLAIMISSEYHARALGIQVELCAVKAVTEKSLAKVRILRGIAATLQSLLEAPDRRAPVLQLRLRALNSTHPLLSTSEANKVMEVVLGLTSSEAKDLAIKTQGRKAWPFT